MSSDVVANIANLQALIGQLREKLDQTRSRVAAKELQLSQLLSQHRSGQEHHSHPRSSSPSVSLCDSSPIEFPVPHHHHHHRSIETNGVAASSRTTSAKSRPKPTPQHPSLVADTTRKASAPTTITDATDPFDFSQRPESVGQGLPARSGSTRPQHHPQPLSWLSLSLEQPDAAVIAPHTPLPSRTQPQRTTGDSDGSKPRKRIRFSTELDNITQFDSLQPPVQLKPTPSRSMMHPRPRLRLDEQEDSIAAHSDHDHVLLAPQSLTAPYEDELCTSLVQQRSSATVPCNAKRLGYFQSEQGSVPFSDSRSARPSVAHRAAAPTSSPTRFVAEPALAERDVNTTTLTTIKSVRIRAADLPVGPTLVFE